MQILNNNFFYFLLLMNIGWQTTSLFSHQFQLQVFLKSLLFCTFLEHFYWTKSIILEANFRDWVFAKITLLEIPWTCKSTSLVFINLSVCLITQKRKAWNPNSVFWIYIRWRCHMKLFWAKNQTKCLYRATHKIHSNL